VLTFGTVAGIVCRVLIDPFGTFTQFAKISASSQLDQELMNKKLSDWASIAEIVSGVAVVVTLIFLLLGIQANTAATQATVYSSIIDSVNGIQQSLYEDPELSRLYDAYVDRRTAELEEADQRRVRRIAASILRVYEKAYFGREYGVIGDAEWQRTQGAICLHRGWSESAGMGVTQSPVLTEEFREFIATVCVDSDQ